MTLTVPADLAVTKLPAIRAERRFPGHDVTNHNGPPNESRPPRSITKPVRVVT